jgi:hypothetical protein
MNDQQLMNLFHFDESELNANRNGTLTARQLEDLKAGDASANLFSRNVGIALIVGALIGIAILFPKLSFDASLFGLAGCLAPILIGAFFLRIGLRKSNFTLTKAEGKANIVIENEHSATLKRRVSKYVLHVGDASFEIEPEAAGVIMQGEKYAVYYVYETDKIISIENIEQKQ